MLKRTLFTLAAAAIAATAAISVASARGHGHGGHHGGHHGHAHHARWHAHGHAHGHRWSRHGHYRHFSHFRHFRHFSHFRFRHFSRFHRFNHYRRFAHYHYGHYRWAGRTYWRGRGYGWWARNHRWYYPGVRVYGGGGYNAPTVYASRPVDGDRPCVKIVAACRQAGFVQGGANAGNGLQLDCIVPIIQGTPQPRQASLPLPQIAPRLVAACRARNPEFGQLSEAASWAAAKLETERGYRNGPRARY